MDTRSLRYVQAIARHQNLTKAAEELHVGQPTLSKFLQALESDLGLKLFQKAGHRFVLTYAGERYIKKTAEILLLEEDLQAEMADIRKRDAGEIRVFFANMRSSYTLPAILPAFEKLHPNVQVLLFDGNSEENDRRLIEGEIDVAFYSRPVQPHPLIEYRTLAREELLIVTPCGHPLRASAAPLESPEKSTGVRANSYEPLAENADDLTKAPGAHAEDTVLPAPATAGTRYPALDLSLLKNERVILMQPGQRTRQTVDDLLKKRQVYYEHTLCTTNIPAVIGLVSAGYGVSFLFDTHVLHRPPNIPVDCYSIAQERVFRDFVAAVRKGSYLSRNVLDMIELTRQYAKMGQGTVLCPTQ